MKIIEIIKLLFISFEAVFLLTMIAALQFYPVPFELIGNQIKANNEIWKFIPTIPLAICVFSIQYAWKILNPINNSSNRILHEWPNYWKLKFRVISSIIICAACVAASLIIWIYATSLSDRIMGAIFIASCCIALIVALSELLAAFKVRELMEP
jgi:hypothetical protein